MATNTVLLMLALHFLGDFILQSDWMAINKSKRFDVLALHCLIYGAVFILPFGFLYAGINGALHFAVDAITSRVSATLWQKNERHWFFVVIGLDQLIHYTCLILTK